MKKSERQIQTETMLLLGKQPEIRIFRNNTGQAWQGDKVIGANTKKPALINIHPVNFGLCKGSSDLIGIKSVTVTPDMVGQKLGVIMCIEEKKEGWKKPRSEHEKTQAAFIEAIKKRGGIAFFSTCAKEALETVKNWIFYHV